MALLRVMEDRMVSGGGAGQVTVLKGATIIDGTGKAPMPYGVS